MESCAPNHLVLLDLPGGAERNLINEYLVISVTYLLKLYDNMWTYRQSVDNMWIKQYYNIEKSEIEKRKPHPFSKQGHQGANWVVDEV